MSFPRSPYLFPATATVYDNNGIIPFSEPSSVGNQAIRFSLITARVDNFYCNLLYSLDGYGDKAHQKLSSYCAIITMIDKSYYHHEFTTLHFNENESATYFLKTVVIAKTKAEIDGNIYSDHDVLDFLLAAINSTGKTKSFASVQLYLAKRDKGDDVSFAEIKHCL
jgi:hypothetical protein